MLVRGELMGFLVSVFCPAPFDQAGMTLVDTKDRDSVTKVVLARIDALKYDELEKMWIDVCGMDLEDYFDYMEDGFGLTQHLVKNEAKDYLKTCFLELWDNHPHRYVDTCTLREPPVLHWFTAGISSGDDPTDAYAAIRAIAGSCILDEPIPCANVVAEEPVRNVEIEKKVMDAEVPEERSEWMWFRCDNGDLIFGCYPQDELYLETEINRTI